MVNEQQLISNDLFLLNYSKFGLELWTNDYSDEDHVK